jgi:hypothetical protein
LEERRTKEDRGLGPDCGAGMDRANSVGSRRPGEMVLDGIKKLGLEVSRVVTGEREDWQGMIGDKEKVIPMIRLDLGRTPLEI